MKTYNHEKIDKTPEEQLGLAKIQIMFEDSFGIFNAKSFERVKGSTSYFIVSASEDKVFCLFNPILFFQSAT